jgi:hypothetical protein
LPPCPPEGGGKELSIVTYCINGSYSPPFRGDKGGFSHERGIVQTLSIYIFISIRECHIFLKEINIRLGIIIAYRCEIEI